MAWPVDMRSEERTIVLAAFSALFGMTAAHSLVETARDALFLAKVPITRLLWVYVAIAALGVLLGRVRGRRGGGARPQRIVPGLLFGAAVTLAFWAATYLPGLWVPYALYLWPGLYGVWVTGTLWNLVGSTFTLSQAKRLFGFIGGGGVLGALAGAGLSRVLTAALAPQHLLPVAAALLLASGIGPARSLDRTPALAEPSTLPTSAGDDSPQAMKSAVRALAGDPYAKRILALVLLATMAFTTADFLFKSSVAANVPTAELGRFLATISVLLNGLALVTQLVLVRLVLRFVGVHRALSIFPLLMMVGAVGVVAVPVLAATVIVRGIDGTFRHSLHKTTSELLFVPLSQAARARLQPIIDLLGQRGGQVLASLALLPIFAAGGERALGVAVLLLAGGWLVVAVTFKKPYLDVFRKALREGRIDDTGELPNLDLSALEVLFSALNSDKDTEVLGALDLLAAQDRRRLIPALILFHPSKPIVLRALTLFAAEKRVDFLPVADRLVADHADPEVRAAALRARWEVMPDVAFMRSCLEARGSFPEVRATTLALLVSRGALSDEEARRDIDALASDTARVRLALAQAIALAPAPAFEDALLGFASDPDPELRVATAWAMGRVGSARFVPVLIDMLAGRRESGAARVALTEVGEPAFLALQTVAGDPHRAVEARWRAVRALGQFGGERTAAALVTLLQASGEQPMLQTRIVRALAAVRAADPRVPIDRRALSHACEEDVRAAFDNLTLRIVLENSVPAGDPRRTPVFDLMVGMLRDDEGDTIARVCVLLGLLHPRERFEHIHRGLRSRNPKARSSSRELIEHVVSPPLRDGVLALVDDGPDTHRLARAGSWSRRALPDLPTAVRTLFARSGDVGNLAGCFAAEIQLIDADETTTLEARAPGSTLGSSLASRVRELLSARREVRHAT